MTATRWGCRPSSSTRPCWTTSWGLTTATRSGSEGMVAFCAAHVCTQGPILHPKGWDWSAAREQPGLVDDRTDVTGADPADPRLETTDDAGGVAGDDRVVLDLAADDR